MNTSYNYADLMSMGIISNINYEPAGHQQKLDAPHESDHSSIENRIENMLLNHSKYYIYCE